jgi:hypothetical protein
MNINNETVGISAEVAIIELFNTRTSDSYEERYLNRADRQIVEHLKPVISAAFRNCAGYPVCHVAERQNPIDFHLSNGQTLSVKTNIRSPYKVAPERIGQPTDVSYFEYFGEFLPLPVIPDDYWGRRILFKEISVAYIGDIISHYWENLFNCDYLLWIYDVLDKRGRFIETKYRIIQQAPVPGFNSEYFDFSHLKKNKIWNESSTLGTISLFAYLSPMTSAI